MNEENTSFQVTWTHAFSNYDPDTETVYFAWTYPYSFEESLVKTQGLIKKYEDSPSVYVHREVLTYSREKRPMEMITFTSREGMRSEREQLIDGCFPDANGDTLSRPFQFDKPTVFISARVHPGETPASFVLDGIVKFLCEENQ
jgi:hypothetical protein